MTVVFHFYRAMLYAERGYYILSRHHAPNVLYWWLLFTPGWVDGKWRTAKCRNTAVEW